MSFSLSINNNQVNQNRKECPVCFDENYDSYAATLKCGHKLCSKCLAGIGITQTINQKTKVKCPICRSIIIDIKNMTIDEGDYHSNTNNNMYLKLSIFMCLFVVVFFATYWILMYLSHDMYHV